MESIYCEAFPNKKRYGRRNHHRAAQDAKDYQRKYKKNYRVYKCDSCNGLHLSTSSINEYIKYSSNSQDKVNV